MVNLTIGIEEEDLESKSTLGMSDYVRVVGADGVSYKQELDDVSNKVITEYTDIPLAGNNQSVKDAINTLDNEKADTSSVQSSIDTVNDRIDNIITSPAPTEQEIIDARFGADGVTYPSLGDAIREQVTDVKSALGYPNTINVSGSSLNTSTGLWQNASGNSFTVISISPDQTLKIQRNTDHPFLYCLLSDYTGVDIGNSPSYATGFSKPVTVSSATLTDITIPNDAQYLWLYSGYTGANYFPKEILIDGLSYFASVRENLVDICGDIDDIKEELATDTSEISTLKPDVAKLKNDTLYDVAVGGMFETATTNDVDSGYIASVKSEKKQRRSYPNKRIVAVNHDDLQPSDYLATRKIYNKYGYNANFNFILLPFVNAEQQERMIKNVKALVADGHDLGLHAIMGASFWWINKMWDLRPTLATTFAPELSDLKTVDASGKNVFGYTVGDSTKFENIGYANPPSQVTSVLVKDATAIDWIYLTTNYTLYTMYMSTVSGLDLDGNTQNWTGLHWLEYWYNELIDDTLGYSKNSQSLSNNYIEDYAVPIGTAETSSAYNAVYPDATHLLNGKVVRFDDTTNPHYNDADYQKVGYFTKGLFKGCVSACNYEVIDRCIDIAKAFCKHYFGVDKFTNFGKHGVRYADCTWKDENFVPYDNRSLKILTGEVGEFYHSRSGKFLTEQDILLDKGIRMTNHNHPLNPIFESEVGLYYGQSGIRYPFFNHALDIWNGAVDYLAFFGTSPSGASETMDYDTFISYMGGRDNWLKYAYEKANSYFTKPDGTGSMYMFGRIKKTIDMIRACVDSGKIPVFSWDTIKLNAATMAAVELVCQYCYANNIDIVPMEYAREMATNYDREYRQNWFPNPTFTQSVLNMFGGVSTSHDAYRPDGWVSTDQGGTVEYSVADETVDNKTMKVLTISMGASSYANLQGRIYGLPAGKYKFSVYLKRSDYAFNFRLYLKKNKDFINRYYGDGNIKFNPDVNFSATSEWVLYEQEIEIPEFHVNAPSDTVESQYCKGYEDNVSNITYEVSIQQRTTAHDVYIAMPKLERII